MATRTIIKRGDALLKKVSRPVKDFNERLWSLLDDMKETLELAGGVGLAAPQVSVLRRAVIVLDEEGNPMEMVNPSLTARSQETCGMYEGCLSVPGVRGWVERPEKVVVRFQDRFGEVKTLHLEGLQARCVQHEIDHLDGHLYTELTDQFIRDEELK